MTDLRKVGVVTIEPTATMEAANLRMIQHRIRLLLVVDDTTRVFGIITATDILGEKPVKFVQETGISHKEILVRDIMIPQDKVEVLDMGEVSHAKVGNILTTLTSAGRQHALVVDRPAFSLPRVRGIFSTSHIARQLGIHIQTAGWRKSLLRSRPN